MQWTVDYGDGPRPCAVPHVWHLDVDVRWEGPAIYQATVSPPASSWLVFHGVSYQARVFVNDVLALEHCGIWDAFAVALPAGESTIRVEVVKNGGATFPVKDVLSGFLPYVFHTFGGIFREVEIVQSETDPTNREQLPPKQRISVEETKLFIDGRPWFMRGVLSWGWYPETCSPHPSIETVREEVRRAKASGFNLIKFCLWLPPHHYFRVLEEEDMWAWVELPLWLPSESMDLEVAFAECERIVRQYAHHDRIVCWTCGCELSHSSPHEFRKRLFEMVRDLTGCPLVKDNSGGAEMYGGDLREYGTFYDFHPYCDTMFYPQVLESLMIGSRKKMPILLGEYNDYDTYRPLSVLREEKQYWASDEPRLNNQGVRWQFDLPGVIADPTKALPADIEDHLQETSQLRSRWIREYVTRAVASQADIAGYVVTGLCDTPISTSGVLSDQVFTDTTFFIIPARRPPWVDGGNRPGLSDCANYFAGTNTIHIGGRSTSKLSTIVKVGEQEFTIDLPANEPVEIVSVTHDWKPGNDTLSISGDLIGTTSFPVRFHELFDWASYDNWSVRDSESRLGGDKNGGHLTMQIGSYEPCAGIAFLTESGTNPMPFWRECVTWNQSEIEDLNSWDFLFPVSTDRVIDPDWLDAHLPGAEWLLTRVDTRTYSRHPYLVRKGDQLITTLRPWGGLGAQPNGFANNPAGHSLLKLLINMVCPQCKG